MVGVCGGSLDCLRCNVAVIEIYMHLHWTPSKGGGGGGGGGREIDTFGTIRNFDMIFMA